MVVGESRAERGDMRTLGRAVLALAAILSILLGTGGTAQADSQWSGTLTQAIDHIPVAGEVGPATAATCSTSGSTRTATGATPAPRC